MSARPAASGLLLLGVVACLSAFEIVASAEGSPTPASYEVRPTGVWSGGLPVVALSDQSAVIAFNAYGPGTNGSQFSPFAPPPGQTQVAEGSAAGFSQPRLLSHPCEGTSAPLVAADAAGDALVVWGEGESYDIGHGDLGVSKGVWVAFRAAGAAFGQAVQLDVRPLGPTPLLVMNRRGDAALVGGDFVDEYVALRSSNGGVQRVVKLPSLLTPSAIALDGGGGLWIAGKSGARIQLAYLPPGGALGSFTTIATAQDPYPPGDADIALNDRGDGIVFWSDIAGLHAMFRHPNGSLDPAIGVAPRGSVVGAKITADGQAVLVWKQDAGLRAARITAGGPPSSPIWLSDPEANSSLVAKVAMNRGGDAAVVWMRGHALSSGIVDRPMAAFAPAGGQFGPPVILSQPDDRYAYQPVVAIHDTAAAVVAWSGIAADRYPRLYVKTLSAAGLSNPLTVDVHTPAPFVCRYPPPPLISHFRLTRSPFRVRAAGNIASTKRRLPLRGTRFHFNLARAPAGIANVTIKIDRLLAGRRVGRRCRRSTRALRSYPRCVLARTRGAIFGHASAGANAIAFTGRVHGKPLSAGRYRATVTALALGAPRASTPRRATFTIVGG